MSEPASYPPPLPAPLYQGSVNTWECDDGGHLNVRFHLERMMIGLAHFARALEMPHAFTKTAGATLVPLEAHLRFLKEARPGAPLVMHGGVADISENQATLCLDMRHANGAPGTACTLRVAHADTRGFRAFPWSERSRAAAKRLSIKLPQHAAPRSLDPATAPTTEASRDRAIALGAARIGATIVNRDQCDVFGRLRGEHFIGRVSDSVPNLMAGWRRDAGAANNVEAAGAVVEARLVFRRFPQAGDLIEIYTGVAAVGDKTFRLVHWLCDPESGGVWASMEAVALTFDTKTRKAIQGTPEQRAKMQARVIAMQV
ncbi:MAG: thioesterase family protein [Proteobacteria bacterium]|nr:thioesterase family protein [Pseudomonadota bacterium]